MRKHFLILMLLSLLPLAGWAQDIAGYTFSIGEATYTYSAAAPTITTTLKQPNVDDPLVLNTNYELVYYPADSDTPLDAAPVNVGTYRVGAKGIGSFEGYTSTKVPYNITPKNLQDTHLEESTPTADLTITGLVYTACRESNPSSATYDGEAWQPTATVALYGFASFVKDTDYEIEYGTNTNAGTEAGTITVKAKSANFTGSVTAKFNIAKANIDSEDITAPVAKSGLKYTGNNQNLVTPGSVKNNVGTIQYKVGSGEYSTNLPQGLNADDYSVSYKVVGDNNHNDVTEASLSAITIGKQAAKLRIVPIAKTETYNGAGGTIALNTAQFSITGWAAGDGAAVQRTLNGLVAKLLDGNGDETSVTEVGPSAGTYKVKANKDAAKYTNAGGEEILLSTNYDFTLTTNVWTIKKKTLTITATANGTVAVGGTDPGATLTQSGAIEAEAADVLAAYKVASTASTSAYGTFPNVYTPTRKESTDYTGTKEEKTAAVAAATALLANYCGDEQDDDIKIVKGSLTVTGAAFSIFATLPNTIEYGTSYEDDITYLALDDADGIATVDESKVSYVYKDHGGNTLASAPTAVGDYTIEVAASNEIGTGNFQQVTPSTPSTPFSIVSKTINLTIPAIELWNGATKTILNQKFKVADYSDQLVGDETLEIELDFAASITNATITVDDETNEKTITFEEGYSTQSEAIIAKVIAGGEYNDNYTITYTGGNLSATDLATLDLEISATSATKVADAAAICAANEDVTYDVTIAGRTLAANDWNVLVLPFDITPFDFCEEIGGYAIFNTLKSADAANNTMKFGLELANLPANEPFLVKPLAAVDFDETDEYDAPVYKFDGVKIVAGEPVKTVSGVKFIGTYETKNVLVAGDDASADFAYVNDGGEAGQKIMFLATPEGEKAGWYTALNDAKDQSYNILTLASTKAYLDFNGTDLNAPLITVEEADGSTTAISAITSEGVAVKAEGWYNLNGVKMQGVPTQKGVYIQNGKKIIVK